MRLQSKIAIVTGAGGGFGEGIAKRFAKEGAKIAVVDIRGDAAERVAGEIGQAAIALTADVSAAADVQRIVDETKARPMRHYISLRTRRSLSLALNSRSTVAGPFDALGQGQKPRRSLLMVLRQLQHGINTPWAATCKHEVEENEALNHCKLAAIYCREE